MSAAQWKRTIEPLLDSPGEWGFRGKLTYHRPVGWVVRGVFGEGSGFRKDRVHVYTVWAPLFMPAQDLLLDHSRRVPTGTATFALDEPGLVDALRAALDQVPTEADALRAIARTDTEEAAYAWLLLGERRKAERRLARPFGEGDDRPFMQEARGRRASVARLLRAAGPEAAFEQLREWRDGTAAALRVTG